MGRVPPLRQKRGDRKIVSPLPRSTCSSKNFVVAAQFDKDSGAFAPMRSSLITAAARSGGNQALAETCEDHFSAATCFAHCQNFSAAGLSRSFWRGDTDGKRLSFRCESQKFHAMSEGMTERFSRNRHTRARLNGGDHARHIQDRSAPASGTADRQSPERERAYSRIRARQFGATQP